MGRTDLAVIEEIITCLPVAEMQDEESLTCIQTFTLN